MEKPVFSIIVPAYFQYGTLNIESINSALNQSYAGPYEIVVSGQKEDVDFVKSRITPDARVRFCVGAKAAPGAKRNLGIAKANGRYIIFLDSDDLISSQFLEVAEKAMAHSDLAIFGFTRDKTLFDTTPFKTAYCIPDHFHGPSEVGQLVFEQFSRSRVTNYNVLIDSIWGKVFSKAIIDEHNLRFIENDIRAEDLLFVLNYSKHVHDIATVSAFQSYFWRVNPKSLMNSGERFYEHTAQFVEELHFTLSDVDRTYTGGLTDYCGSLSLQILDRVFLRYRKISEYRLAFRKMIPGNSLFFRDTVEYLRKTKSLRLKIMAFAIRSRLLIVGSLVWRAGNKLDRLRANAKKR